MYHTVHVCLFYGCTPLQGISNIMVVCTLRKFAAAVKGHSALNTLHFSDFRPQPYGLVNKSFSHYAGMAHFLIESQVPLF